jgi:DNA-binding response OmpR family regulator
MMPRLDGYGTLAALKSDEQLRHIPVIMISALDELSSVVRCIEAGAEDYLPKPFNATLLRARVGACLDKKALRDQEVELYHSLVISQQRLDRELGAAHRRVATLEQEVRDDPRVAPLLEAFQRMSGAVSRRETDLRATIQDLEIKINRKVVTTQVKSILEDPSFDALTERARAMRARRRDSGTHP